MQDEPTKPLFISTKIPLIWILAVAAMFGVWQGSESMARSAYEATTNGRIERLEKNICSIQENMQSIHAMSASTGVDVAVMQNDQKHIIELLNELKTDIKGLKGVNAK